VVKSGAWKFTGMKRTVWADEELKIQRYLSERHES
jgi:hypothetical protein